MTPNQPYNGDNAFSIKQQLFIVFMCVYVYVCYVSDVQSAT